MENTKIQTLIERNIPFSIFTKPGQGVVTKTQTIAQELGYESVFLGWGSSLDTLNDLQSRIENGEKFILILQEFDCIPYDFAKELLKFIENRSGMFPTAIIHHSENEVTQMLKERSLQVEL
ncbi:hypothetical protein WCWAEYFT_CDS0307 [Vibrio phage VB_VaC_TDDLMA]